MVGDNFAERSKMEFLVLYSKKIIKLQDSDETFKSSFQLSFLLDPTYNLTNLQTTFKQKQAIVCNTLKLNIWISASIERFDPMITILPVYVLQTRKLQLVLTVFCTTEEQTHT